MSRQRADQILKRAGYADGGGVRGMTTPGNIDLSNRPMVKNGDGYSTVRSMSRNIDGREVLMPTVSDDGRLLSNDEATDQYRKSGKHLGVFDTPENATDYAIGLHNDQAKQYDGAAPRNRGGRVRRAEGGALGKSIRRQVEDEGDADSHRGERMGGRDRMVVPAPIEPGDAAGELRQRHPAPDLKQRGQLPEEFVDT